MQDLSLLVSKWPRADRSCTKLEHCSRLILANHWREWLKEATRLDRQRLDLEGAVEIGRIVAELKACMSWMRNDKSFSSLGKDLEIEYGKKIEAKLLIKELRVGLGSPGYAGCFPVAASHV